MRGALAATVAVAGAAGAAAAVRSRRGRSSWHSAGTDGRWLVVTVLRPPQEVLPEGRPPQPLADLGGAVEVEVRPAPGDRGSELAARFRPGAVPEDATDAQRRLRTALRESKQLLEVGEVIRIDPRPAGRRKATPTGALLDAAVRRAPGEGVL